MVTMITQYHFHADTAELLWEIQWPMPGVRTCLTRYKYPHACETVVMTVREGYAAHCEIVDWRRSLNDVKALSMPQWLFWLR